MKLLTFLTTLLLAGLVACNAIEPQNQKFIVSFKDVGNNSNDFIYQDFGLIWFVKQYIIDSGGCITHDNWQGKFFVAEAPVKVFHKMKEFRKKYNRKAGTQAVFINKDQHVYNHYAGATECHGSYDYNSRSLGRVWMEGYLYM